MRASIIKIGNSKGLRFSKTILEKYNIGDEVEIILEKEQIVIKPLADPRKNWKDSFIKMHEAGDDNLLIDDVLQDENFDEWN